MNSFNNLHYYAVITAGDCTVAGLASLNETIPAHFDTSIVNLVDGKALFRCTDGKALASSAQSYAAGGYLELTLH